MDKHLAEKARQATSPEELSKMAKEEGIALSDSQADAIYSQFHSGDRELEDDELANVSGGSCSTAAELSKKYGAVQPDSVCGEFVWAYVYFGRRPQDHVCQNCHFCTTSKDAAQKISLMPVTGFFCEKQPK